MPPGEWSCAHARRIAREETGDPSVTLGMSLFDAGLRTIAARDEYRRRCVERAEKDFNQCADEDALPGTAFTTVREVGDALCLDAMPCGDGGQ